MTYRFGYLRVQNAVTFLQYEYTRSDAAMSQVGKRPISVLLEFGPVPEECEQCDLPLRRIDFKDLRFMTQLMRLEVFPRAAPRM